MKREGVVIRGRGTLSARVSSVSESGLREAIVLVQLVFVGYFLAVGLDEGARQGALSAGNSLRAR